MRRVKGTRALIVYSFQTEEKKVAWRIEREDSGDGRKHNFDQHRTMEDLVKMVFSLLLSLQFVLTINCS